MIEVDTIDSPIKEKEESLSINPRDDSLYVLLDSLKSRIYWYQSDLYFTLCLINKYDQLKDPRDRIQPYPIELPQKDQSLQSIQPAVSGSHATPLKKTVYSVQHPLRAEIA